MPRRLGNASFIPPRRIASIARRLARRLARLLLNELFMSKRLHERLHEILRRQRETASLRGFAESLHERRVLSLAQKDAERRRLSEILIRHGLSGETYRLQTLVGTSTYADLYQEVRTLLGIPLNGTPMFCCFYL